MTEWDIGRGIFAAEKNNDDNSVRGTFVKNLDAGGGKLTLGGSSAAIAINVAATVIRVQGSTHNLSDGQVTLATNNTGRPRRDLVIARAPQSSTGTASYEVLTGTPIDDATMQTLIGEGVVGDGTNNPVGYPIEPPENIPEVQPPKATGLRNSAAVLGMVWALPGATDSTDIEDRFITDLRTRGVSFADVLRAGDAVSEIESQNGPVAADISGTAGSASNLDGGTSEWKVQNGDIVNANHSDFSTGQEAIDFAENHGHHEVVFPARTADYEGITISQPGMIIRGTATGVGTDNNTPSFYSSSGIGINITSSAVGTRIESVAPNSNPSSGSYGVYIGAKDCTIRDVNVTQAGDWGINVNRPGCLVTGCRITNTTGDNVRLTASSGNCSVTGNIGIKGNVTDVGSGNYVGGNS